MNEIITADYFAVVFAKEIYQKALGTKPRIIFDKSQARRKSMVTDMFKVEYPFVVVMREGIEVIQNFPAFLTFTENQHQSTIQYRVPVPYKVNYRAFYYLTKESEITQILSNVRPNLILTKDNAAVWDIVVEGISDRMINPSSDELVFVAEINYHLKILMHMENYQEFPRDPNFSLNIQVEESTSKTRPFYTRKRKVI